MNASLTQQLTEAIRERNRLATEVADEIRKREELLREYEALIRVDKRQKVLEEDESEGKERRGWWRRLWDAIMEGLAMVPQAQPVENRPSIAPPTSQAGQIRQAEEQKVQTRKTEEQKLDRQFEQPKVAKTVDETPVDGAVFKESLKKLEERLAEMDERIKGLQDRIAKLESDIEQMKTNLAVQLVPTVRGIYQLREPVTIQDTRGQTYQGTILDADTEGRPIVRVENLPMPVTVMEDWKVESVGGAKNDVQDGPKQDEGGVAV